MADTNPPARKPPPPSYVGAPVPLGPLLQREEPTNPGVKLEVVYAAEKKRKKRRPWYIALISLLLSGGGGAGVVGMVRGTAAKTTVEERTTKLEGDVAGLKEDVGDLTKDFKEERTQRAEDTRALYQAVISRGTRRSERLERPVDGGSK